MGILHMQYGTVHHCNNVIKGTWFTFTTADQTEKITSCIHLKFIAQYYDISVHTT